jgi:8-amino-7-oxononanoate synthase
MPIDVDFAKCFCSRPKSYTIAVMRPRLIMESAPGPFTTINGREYLYFAGTGYLGIQSRPELIDAAADAMRRYGMGSATTRSGFGNSPPVLEVERLAAEFFGAEAAFYFSSGYAGPAVAVLAASPEPEFLFMDEASHFSVADAARLLGKTVRTFAHRDADALKDALRGHLSPGGRPMVIADGVFSVSGRITPVPDYLEVLANYPGASLVVDDAHAVAVLGDRGRGTLEHFGLFGPNVNDVGGDGPRLFMCGTLSKAVGGAGGIVPGSAEFIATVQRKAPAYFAASAPSTPAAGATAAALRIVMSEPQLRRQLHENVGRLRSGLRSLGLSVDDTVVPIVSIDLRDAQRMQSVQEQLMAEAGIAIAYNAAYSGVGPNGLLRIAVLATHTEEMIDRLLKVMGAVL